MTRTDEHKQASGIANSFLKYSGIVAVTLQLFVIISTGQMMGFNWLGPDPISDLGVTEIFCVYSIGLMTGAILLMFFLYYLRSTFNTSTQFAIVFGIGIVCEFITGLAPDQMMSGNPFSAISFLHLPAGVILLLTIPASMWLFAHSIKLRTKVKKTCIRLCILYLVLLIPEIILISQNVLYAMSESASLLIFDVWVVYVTLVAFKEQSKAPTVTKLDTKLLAEGSG